MTEKISTENSKPLDATWPTPLPTNGEVRDVFFNELSGPLHETPENHLGRVSQLVLHGDSFSRVTRSLHRTLSVQGYYNRLSQSGRDVVTSFVEPAVLYKHMGMDSNDDLRKGVLVAIRPLLADVLSSGAEPQEKLNTVALSVGTMIAEAQSFSDANTRIARSMHDYIKSGLDGLDIEKISDSGRNFMPPKHIEELVMMQNLTHLVEHPEEPVLGASTMKLSDKAIDLYMHFEGFMRGIWQLNDYESSGDFVEDAKQRYELSNRLKAYLPESDDPITHRALAIMKQKSYAPAAMAATFMNLPFQVPMSAETVERLVSTNIGLMKMRTLSLGVAMARKGIFTTIEDSATGTGTEINQKYWQPTIS